MFLYLSRLFGRIWQMMTHSKGPWRQALITLRLFASALSRQATTATPSEVSSEDLPSVGSKGHDVESCKPCAFFYSKGCKNGCLDAFGEERKGTRVHGVASWKMVFHWFSVSFECWTQS